MSEAVCKNQIWVQKNCMAQMSKQILKDTSFVVRHGHILVLKTDNQFSKFST